MSSVDHEHQDPGQLGWWCIAGDVLLDGLRRAASGEDPDLLYAELYANSSQERP